MLLLIAGLIIFLGVHSVAIVAPNWRAAVMAKIGEGPWKGIYALIALLGLVLIIIGYGMARQAPVVLYSPPSFLRHLVALLMLPVFPLLLAAYLPGKIQAKLKHPMLVAVKLWALAHLLVNGMLADVVLFGSLLVWAVIDRISLKRRPPKSVPKLPASRANDAIAVVAGLIIYVLFVLWGHEWLIGVRPV
jgi:uncharacterized membrane protein